MMRRCFGEKGGFVWRDGYTKYFRYTAIMENIRYTKTLYTVTKIQDMQVIYKPPSI